MDFVGIGFKVEGAVDLVASASLAAAAVIAAFGCARRKIPTAGTWVMALGATGVTLMSLLYFMGDLFFFDPLRRAAPAAEHTMFVALSVLNLLAWIAFGLGIALLRPARGEGASHG